MKIARKVEPFFVDDRGKMYHLLDGKTPIIAALLITCNKGAVRANHYHKKDTHYAYMLKGSMEYTYKNLKIKNEKLKTAIVSEGEIVYTPPMVVHAMKFLEDSVFLSLTTEKRDKKKYERDTVRVKLI